MNRIPVVNDEQRAGYGAPTTEVQAAEIMTDGPLVLPASIPLKATRQGVKAVAKKKPAAKAKAKK